MVGNNGGRPRKVVSISTGKIGKKERLAREKAEAKIKGDRDQLETEIPDWLTEGAKKEYVRIITECGKIPFLDNIDLTYVALYADAYDRYVQATTHLQQEGDVIETDKGPMMSPYVMVLKKAEDTLMKCSTKLGLAITDRLRLIPPKPREEKAENKYLKFLKA